MDQLTRFVLSPNPLQDKDLGKQNLVDSGISRVIIKLWIVGARSETDKRETNMKVIEKPDGWYVDQGEGHVDGPHASQEDAEIVKEAMEWVNEQSDDSEED